MIKFGDIQDAFFFVSSAAYGMNSAFLRKDTGQILYRSEMGDIDEIGDEDLDGDTYIEIPHKNDLDLGQRLVFEFIDRNRGQACKHAYASVYFTIASDVTWGFPGRPTQTHICKPDPITTCLSRFPDKFRSFLNTPSLGTCHKFSGSHTFFSFAAIRPHCLQTNFASLTSFL
jgi:hypothetical protein